MTSAISAPAQNPLNAAVAASSASGTTSPLQAAVPAQLPVRSYANATKTATATSPAPAGGSATAQHGKADASPVNGATPAMAITTQEPPVNSGVIANGTPAQADHAKKPSVVISASGASGYTPNGGPVGQNGRPTINFGSWNAQGSPNMAASVPYNQQNSGLHAAPRDPRIISPAHSPSPIPQPNASGGRPPSSLQGQSNGLNFGSMGGEGDQMRPGHMTQGPLIPGAQQMHLRRESTQSTHSDMSNPVMQNMNRGFVPQNGRGRGYPQQGYGPMASPAQSFRQLPNQSRGAPNMAQQQFQGQGQMPPGSLYGGRNSPAFRPAQPQMPQSHMGGNSQMPYGYPQHLNPQHQSSMYMQQPHYDGGAAQGYYNAFYPSYAQYPGLGPSQSPRPGYPSAFGTPGQPPFHPQSMSRSASQVSERPASSMGQPQTPSMPNAPPPSQTPASSTTTTTLQAPNFVRAVKKSAGIKITNDKGEVLSFAKASPSSTTQLQPQTPVIVSTPNAPTPPPRAPSSQHDRTESKNLKSSEETKTAFQEQVKRQVEEAKRKEEEEKNKVTKDKADVDAKVAKDKADSDAKVAQEKEVEEAAQRDVIKQAAADAEAAAAKAAHDMEAQEAASKATSDEDEKARVQKEEDERLEREIEEMEAREREEEEREKVYAEKKRIQKEASKIKEAEAAEHADEEMKRLEREAEEREEAHERERAGADKAGDRQSEEAKSMFASLKKPDIGPGASAPESTASGAETSVSDDSTAMAPPPQPAGQQARTAGAAKSKPTALKLDVSKNVEPPQATPGMKSLKTARLLEITEEVKYPSGLKSPNPALNMGAKQGKHYDMDFLLQFQEVFKEKPSVDWEMKIRETLGPGDEPGSARSQSARTPSGAMPRQGGSNRMQVAPMGQSFQGGPMGAFVGGARSLPQGTTSEQRFAMSQGTPGQLPQQRPGMGQAFPQMGRAPSGVGPSPMSRTASVQSMQGMGGPHSPRQPSGRGGGRGGSRRDGRAPSRRDEAEAAAKMPLTAHMEIKALEPSTSGWKPTSIGRPMASGPDPSGNMAPDLVQRKVKAALNKMTPEKFDKISDQVLEIAAQSKNETDGRTLRQVIALTFEKACDEAHWASMYAKFCQRMLTTMSTEIRDETITDKNGQPVVGGALFRKYLLNRCQEEFERGWEVNLPAKPEGDSEEAALLSDEYYIAAAAKRRGLGLIQFIGELYKLTMLTVRIMAECVQRLLNFEGSPDESAIENLTKLLTTVGETMDNSEQGHQLMDMYFERINKVLANNDELASRPRFMIQDLLDLRRAHWRGKNDSKGPKTLGEIHDEAQAATAKADAERQRTSQRGGRGGPPQGGRGDSRNFSSGFPPPQDYSRTNVAMDDLRKLQNRGTMNRQAGGGLVPGGGLGPGSSLVARSGSRRGNLGPASGSTTRTNTPPVESKDKKEEPTAQTNTFSALAALDDQSNEGPVSEAASPPTNRARSKSPAVAEASQA